MLSNRWKKCSNGRADESQIFQGYGSTIVMEEVKNLRSAQEDQIIAAAYPQFQMLSQEDQKRILETTITQLQKQYGRAYQGSTLCGTIAWKQDNTIYSATTNVGDSTSFMVILDKESKHKKTFRLNQNLHNSHNSNEKERVKKEGGVMINDRLAGTLAMTRSIGDNELDGYGISHQAEIDFQLFKLEEGDQAILIVACDGLTENECLTEEEIGKTVSQYYQHGLKTLPNRLIHAAKTSDKHQSRDNISVGAMVVTSDIPAGITVFDGHGGSDVSKALANHFYAVYHNNLPLNLRSDENSLLEGT